jgi:glycerophosphoryl diester phosphodiesterase
MSSLPPRVIGHRGSPAVAPENTIAGFLRAAHEGASMVELDVRLTHDGVPVVHHDRRLGRTTVGRGRIRELPAARVMEVDAGTRFSPRFRGERIPTLVAVLAALPRSVGVNVEVKTEGDIRRRALYVARLLPLFRAARRTRPLLVSSFDHRLLVRFHAADPTLPLGVLYFAVRDLGVRPSHLAASAGAWTFICSRAQLRRRHAVDAHAHGIRVMVYGVHTARHLRIALRRGADDVITDHPARMVKALHAPAPRRGRLAGALASLR